MGKKKRAKKNCLEKMFIKLGNLFLHAHYFNCRSLLRQSSLLRGRTLGQKKKTHIFHSTHRHFLCFHCNRVFFPSNRIDFNHYIFHFILPAHSHPYTHNGWHNCVRVCVCTVYALMFMFMRVYTPYILDLDRHIPPAY